MRVRALVELPPLGAPPQPPPPHPPLPPPTVMHALGFSSSLYPYFRNIATGEQWGAEAVTVTESAAQNGLKSLTKIVTPKVAEEVKRHFACDNWPVAGGELEDGGGSGTAGSHWEKRVFRDEIMTGTASNDPVLSRITLALFEDSGWYLPNYGAAEHFAWGKDQGCSFPRQSCSTWGSRFFCEVTSQEGCSHDYHAYSVCTVRRCVAGTLDAHHGGPTQESDPRRFSQELPASYQYFSDPFKGGSDSYADYCPHFTPYSNGDCRGQGAWGVGTHDHVCSAGRSCRDLRNVLATERPGRGDRAGIALLHGRLLAGRGPRVRQPPLAGLRSWALQVPHSGASVVACLETECADNLLRLKVSGASRRGLARARDTVNSSMAAP